MSNYDHDGNERNSMGGFNNAHTHGFSHCNSLDQFRAGINAIDTLETARMKMNAYQSSQNMHTSINVESNNKPSLITKWIMRYIKTVGYIFIALITFIVIDTLRHG